MLEGTLEHIVNGESVLLEPGMIGIVRKGDTVSHKVPSDVPCKALVIWAPGGEVERLAQFFESKPIEQLKSNDEDRGGRGVLGRVAPGTHLARPRLLRR